MRLSATYIFPASVERAWDLLMDTGAIGSCLPGCRSLRPVGDDRYEVELTSPIAAIAGDFKGTVALERKVAPDSYTLVVDGSGRQGFIKGRAHVSLAADGDRTLVHVDAQADVGGMIARVGQRLLEGAARAMADKFFACIGKQAEPSR